MSCPICEGNETHLVFRSTLPWSVRSDWTPVNVPAEVWGCRSCGHVFKPNQLTQVNADYVNYCVMGNDPSVDKIDFSTDQPISRSDKIVGHLKDRGFYRQEQRILDYGCNRGAFLARLPPGKHAGFEVSLHYRHVVERLGFEFFSPGEPPPHGVYDGITLIHVLEHLQDIGIMLQPALSAAKRSAFFLFQVPDLKNQISDAYVIDHCSHFFESTLSDALACVGLECVGAVESIIPGELTGVFVQAETPRGSLVADPDWHRVHLEIRKRLEETERRIEEVKAESDNVVVYGAGLLGSLVRSLLGDQVRAFVDDNPESQGKQFMGCTVLSLEQVRGDEGAIVIAVPPTATDRVFQRCLEKGLRPRQVFSAEEWRLG